MHAYKAKALLDEGGKKEGRTRKREGGEEEEGLVEDIDSKLAKEEEKQCTTTASILHCMPRTLSLYLPLSLSALSGAFFPRAQLPPALLGQGGLLLLSLSNAEPCSGECTTSPYTAFSLLSFLPLLVLFRPRFSSLEVAGGEAAK